MGGSLRSSRTWHPGCRRQRQGRVGQGLHAGRQVRVRALLPHQSGHGYEGVSPRDLPGYTKEGVKTLAARCEELHLQPRGTRGESGGQTGVTYDISNKHRLGYSEVELVQKMIDGVNVLYKEDKDLQKKHKL